jgi:hypothetical protein
MIGDPFADSMRAPATRVCFPFSGRLMIGLRLAYQSLGNRTQVQRASVLVLVEDRMGRTK